jgi:hypothetical protein
VLTRLSRPRFSGTGNRVRFHPPAKWHQNPLEGIRESLRATIAIEKALGENVQRARDAGHSWSEIGRALGVVQDAKNADEVIQGLARAKSDLWSRMFRGSPP